MSIDPKRTKYIDHALNTTRLAGAQPSAKFLELAEKSRQGSITVEQLVSEIKGHYRCGTTEVSCI